MTSLAVKGLRPAIKTKVMPMNPQDFEKASQRAILAEKTIISTAPPVAAYIHPPSDARVDELTKMVKDLQTILDEKSNQASPSNSNLRDNSTGARNDTGGNNVTGSRIQTGTSRALRSTGKEPTTKTGSRDSSSTRDQLNNNIHAQDAEVRI